jgi:hypothetical protein
MKLSVSGALAAVAMPELLQCDGQWHIAALLPSLKGTQIARLAWETRGTGARP